MCGVAISRNPGMVKKIAHRGLESETFEVQIGPGVWAGHTRLPIQTEFGDGWAQPIALSGVRREEVLLYNGEIYNYPRKYPNDTAYLVDLFSSVANTDDILRIANTWDGMWAIAIVSAKSALCFTDPLGKKQLYYNSAGEVCSEILPLVYDRTDIDKLYRAEVFKWGYNLDNHTPWNKVRRMMPNVAYRVYFNGPEEFSDFSDGFVRKVAAPWFRWKDVVLPDGYPVNMTIAKPMKECVELVRHYLDISVRRRAMSAGHRVQVLLSGGLDSSIIASILHQNKIPMDLYCVGNEEAEWAEKMAEYLGMKDQLVYIPGDDGTSYSDDEIRDALRYNESPIDLGSLLPQHRMCGWLRKSPIIVTGDGADELFGGYRRNADYDSQLSDVFQELPCYHLPRLDRASMRWTKELRTPFLGHDVVRIALSMPREARTFKAVLKEAYKDILPEEILRRPKTPLKSSGLRENPEAWHRKLDNIFYTQICKNDDTDEIC